MKKVNIFPFLIVFFTFAVILQIANIAEFSVPVSVAESTEAPKKFEQVSDQPPALPEKAAPPAEEKPVLKGALPPQSPYGENLYSASELEVLQSLAKRRGELDKHEQRMGTREALLTAAEVEVDRKIGELNKIRGELEALLAKQQGIQEDRVSSLIKIYEGMKPKEAARIFDTLEMDILLAVIGKMNERKSSPIIASMDPEKARLVTIELMKQHKLPDLPAGGVKKISPAPAPPSQAAP
jgi:flagellar motility protein MotE (MotC chaperone)